ncbi:S8 family serine peptidase [Massilia sp. CF038]|uniref:S8 family serine peptidase n=1 Tax=Massilia sp. CF038 TaxID=1881045 RepID=UPI001E300A8F|nr:S8 family serine peptidase [Massilia sp. CF038]
MQPLGNRLLREPAETLLARRDLGELPDVRALRLATLNQLLGRHRDLLETDPRGDVFVRGQLLAWSPSPAALDAAADAGLRVLRTEPLSGLDETLVVLQVPPGADSAALLARLRARDPDGSYDFNHIYTGSGSAAAAEAQLPAARLPDAAPGAMAVGLIDSGIDSTHPVFHDAAIARWGCAQPVPDAHGTAVAALLVGQSAHFRGAAPGARLYAADIYCASGSGGSAERIAGALAWMAREKVAVINLSLVGPPNQALERVVAAMTRRGHLLVAAVGNDGPAAPPLYPASYPGVVGVSAVDKRGRVLPEAGRGPQVMFAAPGSNMVSAAPGSPPYRQVRGTSFAAPIVAALLARLLPTPDPSAAARAVATLAGQASDGVAGETGKGVVGQRLRIDPQALK